MRAKNRIFKTIRLQTGARTPFVSNFSEEINGHQSQELKQWVIGLQKYAQAHNSVPHISRHDLSYCNSKSLRKTSHPRVQQQKQHAVADDSFATPALTAAKKPATYSLKSRKPKPIITAIAAKIFFIFISLMLLDKGTTTATSKIAPIRTCK